MRGIDAVLPNTAVGIRYGYKIENEIHEFVYLKILHLSMPVHTRIINYEPLGRRPEHHVRKR